VTKSIDQVVGRDVVQATGVKAGRFLIGTGKSEDEDDLPRNVQERALIGDKRND
jgi:hypothetical protein